MSERVLVVEDERTLGTNIARALEKAGHAATVVFSGAAALLEIDKSPFDLVLSDLRLPDVDGLVVLDHVRRVAPETSVVMMTAYASVDSAVDALRHGAVDYLLKPLSLADVVRRVDHIADFRRLGAENARLRSEVRGASDPFSLLARGGPSMRTLCDLLDRVAPVTSTVLITGESGSGKELVARALHDRSPRRDGPFVTLNVGAIPDALLESYLFGHERGAFTGADKRREGLFRAAAGGTLFLDEIGEMPLAAQAKLLRAVETKEVLPVGGDRPVKVDARIVAATHRDLNAMAEAGRFRPDLLYRLSVITLRVPPLRKRIGDLPSIAGALLEKHAREQRKAVVAIDPAALALLERHPWPGNVRELSNALERAVLFCEGDTLLPRDLPIELHALDETDPLDEPAPGTPVHVSASSPLSPADCALSGALLAFERGHIARVLAQTQGNRDAAAKLLGLSPATFYRRLQRVGLKGYLVGSPASVRPATVLKEDAQGAEQVVDAEPRGEAVQKDAQHPGREPRHGRA